MAILATLGDLSIEILLNDFQNFDFKSGYGFATHSKLEGKPSLQQVGDELGQIRFDCIFHRQLIDPELGILQLRTLAEAKRPLSLVFGEVYKGQWVINDIREKPLKVSVRDEQTVINILGCNVELKEFAGGELRVVDRSLALNPFQYSS
ncbi:phage tail protein [Geminocystis sp. NIES-3709]|uniref:phage tail protein n=1 Tax=Geminocystis sp. NIES-3709 TaxID=1617448 RepID=UPI0005FC9141|nr:phage tail protein [Geminocystis sp. NIES-3709]BAQ65518.1 phage protein [Geminocystis sp. NIES-3709]